MGRRHLDTEPVTEDDDAIARALSTVSVSALIAAVALITGDPSYLRGPIRPRAFLHNEFQGNLSEGERSRLCRQATTAIAAWRDAGCPPPPVPTDELIRETLNWVACEPVSDEYAVLWS